jgi:hypothetical protein
VLRWALIEAVQRTPAGTPVRQAKDAIIARRGPRARNIAKVAAARKLLTYVFYPMRDGHVRALDTPPHQRRRPGEQARPRAARDRLRVWPRPARRPSS